jgi:hypothetical protein
MEGRDGVMGSRGTFPFCFSPILGFMILALVAGRASSATLDVGTGKAFREPSEAATAAKSGDSILIAPGTYYDCAVWTAANLTIEGTGPGVVLTDKVCQGKAIFVVHADNVRIANLTFARARSEDENGAGIRAEGVNLTIENSKFADNQEGILAGDNPQSTIVVRKSEFVHNGACISACAHGIYVGHIQLLSVDHCRFFDTQAAHHVKSRALRTEIVASQVEDGPAGTASYLVDLPNGGSLFMIGNTLEKGPQNGNHTAAISIGEEGVNQPTGEIVVTNNTFTNDGHPTALVKNLTATPAKLIGNVLKGPGITPLIGDGTVR